MSRVAGTGARETKWRGKENGVHAGGPQRHGGPVYAHGSAEAGVHARTAEARTDDACVEARVLARIAEARGKVHAQESAGAR